MPIQISESTDGKTVIVQASGKLHKADYEDFVPAFQKLVSERGKLRLLFDLTDFHGWDAGAAWEDFKFGLEHYDDIERFAMVGEEEWQHVLALISKPFMRAKVRYFNHPEIAEARKWLDEE